MKYKIVKYKKKKECPFDTYEPTKRRGISRREALPILIRVGHVFSSLGGLIGFWASSILMSIRGIFGIKEKINKMTFNRKVIELRVKKSSSDKTI